MVNIKGIFRTTSPLFIAAPGEGSHNFATKKTADSKIPGNVPCTRIRQERIINIGGGENSETATSIPVIPGNSIRGQLRRQVADLVFDAIAAKGGRKVSLDVYHTLTCGAATGSPDPTKRLSALRKGMDHPFIGLFGGTNRMIPSDLKVFTGYPICPITVDANIVSTEFFGSKAKTNHLTMVDMFLRRDDIDGNIPPAFTKVVADPDETIAQWFALLEEKSTTATEKINQDAESDTADEAGRSKMTLRNWGSRELVPPGTPFEVGFIAETYDYAKIGLLLLGLERLIKKGAIGGRTSIGYGRFVATNFYLEESSVYGKGESCSLLLPDGSLNTHDATISSYVDAAREFLDKINIDELEELCSPGASLEEKAEKKAKKKKVESKEEVGK